MSEYPNDISPDFPVATAYTADGKPYDYLGNWQTAQTYANEGYQVKVHEGDGRFSQTELQALVDQELADAIDCFGEGHRK